MWFPVALLTLITVVFAIPVGVTFHELGHALAGLLLGSESVLVRVGGPWAGSITLWRLQIVVEGGSNLLKAECNVAGRRLMGPWAQASIAAAGPAASFILAAGCACAAWLPPSQNVLLQAVVLTIGGVSLVLGVANLWPTETSLGRRSDSKVIVDVLRARAEG
jgi:hypothetical protein